MTESHLIEYKESWRDDYLRWVCGFANAEGGTLIIGRNDAGQAIGVADATRLADELPNKIRDLLGIVVPVRLVHEGGAQLLEIVVEAQPTPISYRGEYHIRSGSTRQQLTGAALTAFLLRRLGRHWDSAPVPGVGVADLDPDAFKRFRRHARRSNRLDDDALEGTNTELLDRLRLLEGGQLKRAALMLFHAEPDRFCTGAAVKVGKFDGSEVLHHDLIEGNLFRQLDTTLEVLRLKYLRARITYEGTVRVETFPVPDAALREAIVNALVHKDYDARSPVQIRVYDDRLIITNAGFLPADWTADTLRQPHRSMPANPDIAATFYRAGHIEAWGRGMKRIFDACRLDACPEPILDYDGAGMTIEFPFAPEFVALAGYELQAPLNTRSADRLTPPVGVEVTPQVTLPVTLPVTPQVTPQVTALLMAIDTANSREELQAKLKLVDRHNFKKLYLIPALEAGLIERTIPEKPNSRLQRYRLTAKGQSLITH